MVRPVVIFENEPDFVEVLEGFLLLNPETNGHYFIFPSLEEFRKVNPPIKSGDISALFLDHHLDNMQVGNEILMQLAKEGFDGKVYSMNSFSNPDTSWHEREYVVKTNYPKEKYAVYNKNQPETITRTIVATIKNELAREAGTETDLGSLR